MHTRFTLPSNVAVFCTILFGSLAFFSYLCRVKKRWLRPQNNPNNSPFKTCKIMNKTVRKILQFVGYLIAALLGAAGEATLM